MGFLTDLFQKKPRLAYERPAGWSEESAGGGTLLLAPDLEQDWQANIFIETRKDELSRDLQTAMRDHVASLRQTKKITKVLRTEVVALESGPMAAVIQYVHDSDGMALQEREVMVPMGDGAVVFVLTSTLEALASEYDRVFDRFLASLRFS
jgi:hypothetical protein